MSHITTTAPSGYVRSLQSLGAQDLCTAITHGVASINEVRRVFSLPPVAGGDTPYVATANGWVPVSEMARFFGAADETVPEPQAESMPSGTRAVFVDVDGERVRVRYEAWRITTGLMNGTMRGIAAQDLTAMIDLLDAVNAELEDGTCRDIDPEDWPYHVVAAVFAAVINDYTATFVPTVAP